MHGECALHSVTHNKENNSLGGHHISQNFEVCTAHTHTRFTNLERSRRSYAKQQQKLRRRQKYEEKKIIRDFPYFVLLLLLFAILAPLQAIVVVINVDILISIQIGILFKWKKVIWNTVRRRVVFARCMDSVHEDRHACNSNEMNRYFIDQ